MSTMRQRLQARSTLRTITQLERALAAQLSKELTRVANSASAAYPNWTPVLRQHVKNLTAIMRAHAMRTASAGHALAQSQMRGVKVKHEAKASTEEGLSSRLRVWATESSAEAVVGIGKITRTRIRNAIADGIASSLNPREIARSIRERVGSMSVARAKTIARTETHRGVLGAQQVDMEDSSAALDVELVKIWVATEDARTRESHSRADGQRRKLSEFFRVGSSEISYPGDPDGEPEDVINCRCVVVYEAV